jgi:hypothetical protein
MSRVVLLTIFVPAWTSVMFAPPALAERPRVSASRVDGAIRVDGALDEPEWSSAQPISDFRLIFQREGAVPSESTSVRVLIDDQRLYFGIRCENRGPGKVRASLAPRDQILDGDHVSVHLDTYLDRRRAYIFGINPYGVELDGILDGSEPDFSWDAVWDGASRRDSTGWTTEIAIPLRAMRFDRNGGTWGLWIRREITKNDEVCSWPLWRQADQGDIMLQAGDLLGLEGLRAAGHLELEPYLSSVSSRRTSYFHEPPPSSSELSSHTASNRSQSAGLDLRYPITTTLIANATINPDYGQVEADAIQIDVNQRYPLFYPEKRPFFLEGADIFTSPLGLVYTRRIADPVAGGKLTGKLGRWNLGAIALRDHGGGSTEGVGADNGVEASGPGEFYIGRTAYDVGDNSRVGALVTAHRTDNPLYLSSGTAIPTGSASGGHNVVVAGDSRLRLAHTLFFNGQLAWSESRRADPGSQLGDSRTTTDIAYHASLREANGVRDLELYQDYYGPDFRDESGFISRVDIRTTGVNSSLMLRPENGWLRSWQPILNTYVVHDHTGQLENAWLSPMIDWAFQRQTTMHTMYVRSRERWLDRDYDLDTYIFRFGNTLWRPLALSFDGSVGDGIFYGDTATSFQGWSESYTLGATVRPEARFTMELAAARNRFWRYRGPHDEVFDVWVLGAKTTFQLTREFYVRLYPQYDTGSHHLDADALLAYVFHPGSALYVGVNGDVDRIDGEPRPTQKVLYFKASHRFGVPWRAVDPR